MSRYIEHTNNLPSKIEQRTIDDYKATPMLVAALGGHLELVELLIRYGADISAKIDFRGVKHGLVEMAVIREDLGLLHLAFDMFAESAKRVLTLMGLERLDMESRAAVGRSLYRLSVEYSAAKVSSTK